MKGKIPVVQIVIYVVCIVAAVFAVLIFSGKIQVGSSAATVTGTVTMWGTLPYDAMKGVKTALEKDMTNVTFNYVQEDPSTFQSNLVNALASGTGPDLIALDSTNIVQNYPRLLTIPYASLPESSFKTTFIDQGTQYLKSDGTVALPYVVDPIVMYYNKDMLSSAFVVTPPKTWNDVVALNAKITQKDDAGALSAETVALGTYDNILHAKELLALLAQQGGNPLVTWDDSTGKYVSTFAATDASGNSAVQNAFSFYTSFANANSGDYSWNASLPLDRDQFVAGKLAIYFGDASEASGIRQLNPNLNFGVALVPQLKGATKLSTYGNMTGIAIVKTTPNPALAVTVAQTLISHDYVGGFLTLAPQYAPARNDLLADTPSDDLQTTVSHSAIISQSFLDPDPTQTTALFKKYVDEINSGLATPDQILVPGDSLLSGILQAVQAKITGAQSTYD